jgi:hypothetical protein
VILERRRERVRLHAARKPPAGFSCLYLRPHVPWSFVGAN